VSGRCTGVVCVLEAVDGDLVAHRVVLASASPTLDQLFRQPRPGDADTPGMTANLDLKDFNRETVDDIQLYHIHHHHRHHRENLIQRPSQGQRHRKTKSRNYNVIKM